MNLLSVTAKLKTLPIEKRIEVALRFGLLLSKDEGWTEWAKAYLSGDDRTLESARKIASRTFKAADKQATEVSRLGVHWSHSRQVAAGDDYTVAEAARSIYAVEIDKGLVGSSASFLLGDSNTRISTDILLSATVSQVICHHVEIPALTLLEEITGESFQNLENGK